MIRASALYISLIISILIVLVCGSLLLIGYTYRMQDRKHQRGQQLRSQADSALEIALLNDFEAGTGSAFSLFGKGDDSVSIEKKLWGLYEVVTVKSWKGADTVKSAFMIGAVPEDKQKVFYLSDEDRPVSISGKSLIKGTAYLPKSGIKAAYVESSGYADKTLVYGQMKYSDRDLPKLDAGLLAELKKLQDQNEEGGEMSGDSINSSFFQEPLHLRLQKGQVSLEGMHISGQTIVSSDSMIVVPAGTKLDNVLLVAPYIRIEDQFEGSLQAIASDSLSAGNQVRLKYPSALVVLKTDTAKFQARLRLGEDALLEGVMMAYEAERTMLMPLIQVGKGSMISGEIWSKGYVALSKSVQVRGTVTAIRLMARVSSAIYENYLINVKLDRSALSKYYLSPRLLSGQSNKNKLLCRLD